MASSLPSSVMTTPSSPATPSSIVAGPAQAESIVPAANIEIVFHQPLIVVSPVWLDVRRGRTATHVPSEFANGFARRGPVALGTFVSVAGYSTFRGRRFAVASRIRVLPPELADQIAA